MRIVKKMNRAHKQNDPRLTGGRMPFFLVVFLFFMKFVYFSCPHLIMAQVSSHKTERQNLKIFLAEKTKLLDVSIFSFFSIFFSFIFIQNMRERERESCFLTHFRWMRKRGSCAVPGEKKGTRKKEVKMILG